MFHERPGRRRVLSLIGSAAVGVACGRGNEREPTSPSEPSVVRAAFSDTLNDLLTQQPVASGRILIPDRPPIDVVDGRFSVLDSHELVVGATYSDVLIEALGSIPRRTAIVVQRDGLRVDLRYKLVPLDVISDETLYEQWLQTRGDGILRRWNPSLYQGAFLYDRGLFARGGFKPYLVSTDFEAERTFVESAARIARSEIASMTGGALRDGLRVASETPQSQWPEPTDSHGWLVYFTLERRDDHGPSIMSAAYSDQFGMVDGSMLAVAPGRSTDSPEIRTKTCEAIGAYRRGTVPPGPATIGKAFGTIQYSRKIGHTTADVPDWQD